MGAPGFRFTYIYIYISYNTYICTLVYLREREFKYDGPESNHLLLYLYGHLTKYS